MSSTSCIGNVDSAESGGQLLEDWISRVIPENHDRATRVAPRNRLCVLEWSSRRPGANIPHSEGISESRYRPGAGSVYMLQPSMDVINLGLYMSTTSAPTQADRRNWRCPPRTPRTAGSISTDVEAMMTSGSACSKDRSSLIPLCQVRELEC